MAGLAPWSGTPAGQRALIAALRARVAQQQRIIRACRARDARLAAALRALVYPARRGSGGLPVAPIPFGGHGFDAPMSRGMATVPRAELVSNTRRRSGTPGEPGQGAAAAALSRIGRPYVSGAKGPNAFDCSGLTQWAWAQAGVSLGADTYHQISDGDPVPPGQVRAGDLIFPLDCFGEGGRAGPGHVQLAISPTQVVHAPQPGEYVMVAPMPHGYVARRPLPMVAA
jgi:cell wall-associated NlpC family hydrolase